VDKVAKKRVPLEHEAKIVERIFTMITQGKTRYEVARTLNNNSIPTKSGGKWHPRTIEGMITNHSYIGITYLADDQRR